MFEDKVFVLEVLGAVNTRRSGPVPVEKIAALTHEVVDLDSTTVSNESLAHRQTDRQTIRSTYYPVELGALVALWTALFVLGLTGAKLAKVFGRAWNNILE
jgi:hypothetical protein